MATLSPVAALELLARTAPAGVVAAELLVGGDAALLDIGRGDLLLICLLGGLGMGSAAAAAASAPAPAVMPEE